MKKQKNPFNLKGYHGPEYFCDRIEETNRLISNVHNGINTTILSIRRMGKTGLIKHVFNELGKDKTVECIYIDIYSTQNLEQFTNELASSILKVFPQHNSAGRKFMSFIKGLSPVVSYDTLTGNPSISFSFSQPQQYEVSIKGLFEFLNSQKKQVVIAIDEFQQIANYPEKNTEALLRTIIQQLTNVNFIFSGSHKHMLVEMFNSSKRPFFSSTQMLHLDAIDRSQYEVFIVKMFEDRKRSIDNDAIEFILSWTKTHTYFTQALCNRIYATGVKHVDVELVFQCCDGILKEHEPIFYQYRNLLTSSQWNLLIGIAKENEVYQPTAGSFVRNYNLGTAGGVRRSLASLLGKEMILKTENEQGAFYTIYDCFLLRWLERLN